MLAIPDAAGISTAAVPADHVEDLLGAGMIFAEHAEVEIRAVAMVVDGEDFDAFAAGDQVGGAVEDGVDGLARFGGGEREQALAAAGGAQVIEAGAVDVFVFQELEDSVEVLGGVAGEGQAKADLLPGVDAVAEAAHGSLEGAVASAELVVNGGMALSRLMPM